MLSGKSFIVFGISRLGVRIVLNLIQQNADVVCLVLPEDDPSLVAQIPPNIIQHYTNHKDLADLFEEIVPKDLSCLLAVGDDDLQNVRCCVAVREVSPDIPVVLRAFDPALAYQLETGLNVRRAYSVSALSAPAFVAAALGSTVLETLRIGDEEVCVCKVDVTSDSPLVGLKAADVLQRFGCVLVGRKGLPASEGDSVSIDAGEEVILGGPFNSVLEAGIRIPTVGNSRRIKRSTKSTDNRKRPMALTYLPIVAAALSGLILVSVFVFKFALHLSFVDAIYFVITTATTTGYGDITLKDAPSWLKLYGCLLMVSSACLLGILFSYLAAVATAERFGQLMLRRAERMTQHVVVVGLGNVGYRVANQFLDYGVPVVSLEMKEDGRFVAPLRTRTPVIIGDIRLSESLTRTSVQNAIALIACTNDDMANIQACLYARQLNPNIRTVARVFDDTLADRLTKAFKIDCALSPSRIAVGAFLGAASDGRAMRHVRFGNTELACCRITITETVSRANISSWAADGVMPLAYRKKGETPESAKTLPEQLEIGDELIICGPDPAMQHRVRANNIIQTNLPD
jgi:Trk K+ transport system NAD-binding subunit